MSLCKGSKSRYRHRNSLFSCEVEFDLLSKSFNPIIVVFSSAVPNRWISSKKESAGLKAYFIKAGSGIPRWIKQATALRLYAWVSIRRKDKSAYSHHQ